ncbi:MAG: hypothetical protein WHV44_03665 [Anaerolineales bacterium]
MSEFDLKEITVTKTYSLTAWHAQAIKEIARLFGKTDAEVLREAIEAAYARVFSQPNGVTVEDIAKAQEK